MLYHHTESIGRLTTLVERPQATDALRPSCDLALCTGGSFVTPIEVNNDIFWMTLDIAIRRIRGV